jgi:hypothetical protein
MSIGQLRMKRGVMSKHNLDTFARFFMALKVFPNFKVENGFPKFQGATRLSQISRFGTP